MSRQVTARNEPDLGENSQASKHSDAHDGCGCGRDCACGGSGECGCGGDCDCGTKTEGIPDERAISVPKSSPSGVGSVG